VPLCSSQISHYRASAARLRLVAGTLKTWMAGTSPAMTQINIVT
jgi:hypothetical protein